MKKIVAITAFFALLAGAATAQDGDLRLGFELSPTLSWMTTDETTINQNGTNLGMKLHARGEFFFRENYAFVTGFGFSFNTGGRLRHDEFTDAWQRSDIPNGVITPFPAGTDLRYKLQYVEIPFGLKLRTNEIGYIRYYAEIPTFSIGFRSQSRGTIEYQSLKEEKIDIKKEVIPLSFSLGAGAGIEYSISEGTSFNVGLAYQRVITDVTKNYDNVDSSAKINAMILRLAIMF
jgi:hypothetical protein